MSANTLHQRGELFILVKLQNNEFIVDDVNLKANASWGIPQNDLAIPQNATIQYKEKIIF